MGHLGTMLIPITGPSRGWMSLSKTERQGGSKHRMCRWTGELGLSASVETPLGIFQRLAHRGQLLKESCFFPVLVLACLTITLTPSSSSGYQVRNASSFRWWLLLCIWNVFYNSQPVNSAYGFTIPACIWHLCTLRTVHLYWSFGTDISPLCILPDAWLWPNTSY